MILAIDIGNMSIHVGAFIGKRLKRQLSIPTRLARSAAALRRRLKIRGATEAIVCSVVPRATPVVIRVLRAMDIEVALVGRDVRVPLINRYRYPRQVGDDRLVGAYAAWKAYKQDCVVVDIGTAITIDIVTKAGEYLGGVIAPGLDISLEALATKTALLPKVALREPPELLGRDTANSIRSGLLFGCVALCDGLVTQLKRRYAPKAVVVATGGSSALIAKHARTIDYLKPYLVLEGLSRLAS